ncbi:MAG: SurA N-terminal domain-containing protein [Patescibacteria group bacterium]|nr:SurA N-terminal domain-containing protein [Patescibacteria group bacterium]
MKSIKLSKNLKIIIIALFVVFIVIVLISAGYYPVAIVNGGIITDHSFRINYAAAYNYYQKYTKLYNSTSTFNAADFQASIFSQLIDNVLIENELKKELGSNFDLVLNNKLKDLNENQNFENEVTQIYGVDYPTFRQEVFVPEAEQDIMTGRLFLKNQNLNDWLKSARSSAHVIVLSPNFYWDGQEIKTK